MRKTKSNSNTLVFEIGGLGELIQEMRTLVSELKQIKKFPATIASNGGYSPSYKRGTKGATAGSADSYNVGEAAKKLKLSKQTMYNLIKNNQIGFDRISPRKIMFTQDHLNEYSESRKGKGKKRGRKPMRRK